jgi:hypothetical protein
VLRSKHQTKKSAQKIDKRVGAIAHIERFFLATKGYGGGLGDRIGMEDDRRSAPAPDALECDTGLPNSEWAILDIFLEHRTIAQVETLCGHYIKVPQRAVIGAVHP